MRVPQFVYPVSSDMKKVYQVKFDTDEKTLILKEFRNG